ncbi:hypothetical protein BBI01_17910 [Chryseobacterium artocarpi]|uniref:NmrA-like domain-containing protein n=1 Tax=Chryseobacterium artocarpi TaxID=1414727 RepID=A0A1B8ZBT9_9FLAO|nr:SDR family oxidoreductase [Chryseobacterium artocarpi]OCA69088.1 hypothetical protein BBI01_17910 [Chryseobacterium artocarpi]
MILVTGATGALGQQTINFLLEKGIGPENISGLARDEKKASFLNEKGVEVKVGDYFNYSSLVSAFKGVDKLYFISSGDVNNRDIQHQNVVNAAIEAGIKHIVYTSVESTSGGIDSPLAKISIPVLKTEEWIKNSKINYTILKNNFYLEMLPMFLGENVLETEKIYTTTGEGKIGAVLRSDLAEASANVIISDDSINKIYHLSNTDAFNYNQVKDILNQSTGKNIQLIQLNPQELKEHYIKIGLPEYVAESLMDFSNAKSNGEFDVTSDDLKNLLGRKPVSIKEFLENLAIK